ALSSLIRFESSYQSDHRSMKDQPEEASARTLSAYRLRQDGAFDSSELTRGPWDAGHQHAGPPIALAARSPAAAAERLGMRPRAPDRERVAPDSDRTAQGRDGNRLRGAQCGALVSAPVVRGS